MTTNTPLPAASTERRQQVTDEIRKYASGARSERLHPVRVRHAVACGKALCELKGLLGHGSWNQWVEEQCALSRATANRYVRLANRAHLVTRCTTIREAYIAAGIITPKRPPSKRPPDAW